MPPNSASFSKIDQIVLKKYTSVPKAIMKRVRVASIHLFSPEKERVMDREIMTVEQVADYLQISKKSVYQLVHEGKLPASKVLNKWRFNRHSIRQWIASNQSTTQEHA